MAGMTPAHFRRTGSGRAVLLFFFLLCPLASIAQTALPDVTVEGTSFVLRLPDGRVLRSPELVGAVLGLEIEGRIARVRIDAVEREAKVWRTRRNHGRNASRHGIDPWDLPITDPTD